MPQTPPWNAPLNPLEHSALQTPDGARPNELRQSVLRMVESVREEAAKLPRLSLSPSSALTTRERLESGEAGL